MTPDSRFILQALDPDLAIPVLETMFQVNNIDDLHSILGIQPSTDEDTWRIYYPTAQQLINLMARFDIKFDHFGRKTRLHNLQCRGELPYLFHSVDELALLTDGTKKFGYADHFYPPDRHNEEHLFDSYVADGHLHKEVVLEPYDPAIQKKDGSIVKGFRRVYYTRKGEEWRIPAWQLLWSAAEKIPWNSGFERLSSMLFGYEEWQTDFWIKHHHENRGAWGGRAIYISVTNDQFKFLEATGFRAFPPQEHDGLFFTLTQDRPSEEAALNLLAPNAVALVRASISGRMMRGIYKEQSGPEYRIPAERLAELNHNIIGNIEIIVHRDARELARVREWGRRFSSPA